MRLLLLDGQSQRSEDQADVKETGVLATEERNEKLFQTHFPAKRRACYCTLSAKK